MRSRFLTNIIRLGTDEKILISASVISIAGVFLPWISGEWLGGEDIRHNGLSFYTSIIGMSILVLNLFIVGMSVWPMQRTSPAEDAARAVIRTTLAIIATVIALAALSVLMNVAYEFARLSVRIGIYVTIIGSVICTFYAYVKLRELKRTEQEQAAEAESRLPPPPPPPVEEHRIR